MKFHKLNYHLFYTVSTNVTHILFSRSLTFVVWINGFGFEEVNIQENVARRTTNWYNYHWPFFNAIRANMGCLNIGKLESTAFSCINKHYQITVIRLTWDLLPQFVLLLLQYNKTLAYYLPKRYLNASSYIDVKFDQLLYISDS